MISELIYKTETDSQSLRMNFNKKVVFMVEPGKIIQVLGVRGWI